MDIQVQAQFLVSVGCLLFTALPLHVLFMQAELWAPTAISLKAPVAVQTT
jgi:hypothetical protein